MKHFIVSVILAIVNYSQAQRVGINQPNPAFPLHFANEYGSKIALISGDNVKFFGLAIQPGRLQFITPLASDDFVFGTGNSSSFSEKLRITGDGLVGIGTSNPSAPLHLKFGSRNLLLKEDLIPTLEIKSDGTDGLAGIMRFRNALEIQPSADGTRAGYLDVRNKMGDNHIILEGETGKIQAKNLPAVSVISGGNNTYIPDGNGTNDVFLLERVVDIPSDGVLYIEASCSATFQRNSNPLAPNNPTLELKLDEYTVGNAYVATTAKYDVLYNELITNPIVRATIPVTAGQAKRFKLFLYKSGFTPYGFTYGSHIKFEFYPKGLNTY